MIGGLDFRRSFMPDMNYGRKNWLTGHIYSVLMLASKWFCPYCVPGTRAGFTKLGDVLKHVKESNVRKNGEEHERLKADDGWFDEGFYGSISEEKQQENARLHKRSLRVTRLFVHRFCLSQYLSV
jgi:hypothetical protein